MLPPKINKKFAAGSAGSLGLFGLPRIRSLRALKLLLQKQNESAAQKLDI
jgi:hypothetical protein